MKKRNLFRKLNNKGFSLVEVLVAIIILAIATGPLLSSFVSSIRYNAKAKEKQNTMDAAQSIMESFKAYDMKSLVAQFSDPSTEFRVYPTGSMGDYYMTAPANSSEPYVFAIQDMDFEGKKYDAKVEVIPSSATNAVGDGYNTTVVQTKTMNAYNDAIFRGSPYEDINAMNWVNINMVKWLNLLDEKCYGDYYNDYTVDDLVQNKFDVVKETKVIVTGDATTQKATVTRTYLYRALNYPVMNTSDGMDMYQIWDFKTKNEQHGYNPHLLWDPGHELDDTGYDWNVAYTDVIYDNTNTSSYAQLEDLYFFYYPAYESDLYGNALGIKNFGYQEIVIFENHTGRNINIHLVKQKNPLLSDTVVTMLENVYHPSITIDYGPMTLVHNLKENLGGGSTTNLPARWTGITNYDDCADILKKETVNMLFDVKVSIYKDGQYEGGFTGEPLVTIDGTMND